MRAVYKMFTTETTTTGARYVAEGVAASSTDTYYSKKFAIGDDNAIGFSLETTGTLTGTFTLWLSDEPNPSLANDTDWEQDASWAPTNPAAGVSYTKYDITDRKGKWWRIKYVNASGTGNLLGWTVV